MRKNRSFFSRQAICFTNEENQPCPTHRIKRSRSSHPRPILCLKRIAYMFHRLATTFKSSFTMQHQLSSRDLLVFTFSTVNRSLRRASHRRSIHDIVRTARSGSLFGMALRNVSSTHRLLTTTGYPHAMTRPKAMGTPYSCLRDLTP